MNGFFPEGSSLNDIEEFMRSVEYNVKKAMAHLAVALATIKLEGLYLQVASSWKAYIMLERTNLSYRESLKLAKAGELFFRYQGELEAENIKLTENVSKVIMINPKVADHDPMYFSRIKHMSVRQIREYNNRRLGEIYVYPKCKVEGNIAVKGSYLYFNDQKVKGLSLSEIREKMGEGKRLVCIWVGDDENEVRRIRRRISEIL